MSEPTIRIQKIRFRKNRKLKLRKLKMLKFRIMKLQNLKQSIERKVLGIQNLIANQKVLIPILMKKRQTRLMKMILIRFLNSQDLQNLLKMKNINQFNYKPWSPL